MKVLILSNYANGLYLFRKELLQAFRDKGYEVAISVPRDENGKKLEALGYRLIDTALDRRGINPVKDIKLFLDYCKLLKKEKPDVVLTYTIKPNIYGGLACRLKKIPYLVNVTGLGTALESGGILSYVLTFLYRIATGKASCVFFQNEINRQFMVKKGIGKHTGRLLPGSGVNLEEHPFEIYPSEEEGIIFLAVIRIMKDKGIAEYLEVTEAVKKQVPESKFYLVGEYEEETREVYEPQIEKLCKEGILRYFGHIDNVPKVMAESHVILHPSYHEGLSNVLLEAAACGRPVLASNVPGCRETVLPEKSGLLFEAKCVESLQKAVLEILSYSGEKRKEMGIAGRKYVEQTFDRKKVIAAYYEEIEKIQNM